MPCYEFQGIRPVVHPGSFVHPQASLIGDVIVGSGCYIGPGASLRADFGRIIVESDCSVQDCATIHVATVRDTVIRRGSRDSLVACVSAGAGESVHVARRVGLARL